MAKSARLQVLKLLRTKMALQPQGQQQSGQPQPPQPPGPQQKSRPQIIYENLLQAEQLRKERAMRMLKELQNKVNEKEDVPAEKQNASDNNEKIRQQIMQFWQSIYGNQAPQNNAPKQASYPCCGKAKSGG